MKSRLKVTVNTKSEGKHISYYIYEFLKEYLPDEYLQKCCFAEELKWKS